MDKYKAIRIIISGGGTGGHIFPAIAIASEFKRLQPDSQVLFVGAKGKMEMDKVPAAGFEIIGLSADYRESSALKICGITCNCLSKCSTARRKLRR